MELLDVPVSIVDMAGTVGEIERCVNACEKRYVCAADVHSVMLAQRNERHKEALRHAHMVLPDGTPLVWTARLRGAEEMARVCGPDVMLRLCAHGVPRGWRHFFYGGAEGVGDAMARRLESTMPGLIVAGTLSPPFGPRSPADVRRDLDAINAARPDIVWIGLGCPKQEIWMLENSARLAAPVVIGVGAAFDFHAGRIPRAPRWMRDNGLEWLHRLTMEPARLWRRYLVLAPQFLVRAAAEAWRERRP